MRRPRSKLQVSTFPFLAVLLGAMGSLIFLLLVMDRRAKLVSRNKVSDAIEAKRKERATKDADLLAKQQQADEEQQRQWLALEKLLAEQDRLVRGELGRVRADVNKTAAALKDEEAAALALLQEQERLRVWLARVAKETQAKREAALRDEAKVAAAQEGSRLALAKMTVELARLEKLCADLKEQRLRPAELFSVVPYRGKHGANRRPIYIECTDSGLVFQPEGKRLSLLEGTPEQVRDIIRKTGLVIAPLKAPSPYDPPRIELPTERTDPYVLCLIRPDGLLAYNVLSRALDGFDIDFGYELVDADWKLTFPTDMVADAGELTHKVRERPGVPGLPVSRPGPKGDRSGTGGPYPPTGTGGDGGLPGLYPPLGSVTGKGGTGVAGGRPPTGVLPGTGGDGGPYPPGSVPGKGGTGIAGASPPTGTLPGTGSDGGLPGPHPPGSMPGAKKGGPIGKGPGDGHTPGTATSPTKTTGPAGTHTSGSTDGGPGDKQPADLDWHGSKPRVPAKDGEAHGGKEPGGSDGGGSSEGGSPFGDPVKGKVAGRPASLGHLLGNRDFTIHVACTETDAIVTLVGQRFSTEGSAADQTRNAQALVDTVRQLIARRQSTLRSGEPPYRPMIRFQVYPGGLRSYYRVYPHLEQLRVPMTRENVE